MKKRLKLIRLLTIMLLILCVGIAGCGDDDTSSENNLAGDNSTKDSDQAAINSYMEILQSNGHI